MDWSDLAQDTDNWLALRVWTDLAQDMDNWLALRVWTGVIWHRTWTTGWL